jgi:hypothetical protein
MGLVEHPGLVQETLLILGQKGVAQCLEALVPGCSPNPAPTMPRAPLPTSGRKAS